MLILTGNVWQGIVIIVFTFAAIGTIDNLMRIKLVPKDAKLHPMILILTLFGGISVYGPLGFLYGPLLGIVLVTTLEVYLEFYRSD